MDLFFIGLVSIALEPLHLHFIYSSVIIPTFLLHTTYCLFSLLFLLVYFVLTSRLEEHKLLYVKLIINK